MSKRRVVITGMGVISPLSLTLEGFWSALISGRGGVCTVVSEEKIPPPIPLAARSLFSGNIEEFDALDAGQKKTIKKGLKVMSREIQMAVAASCRALNHAGIQIGQFPPDRIGISFGSDYILTTVDDVIDGIRNCCRLAPDGKTFDFSLWARNGMPKMPPLWQLKYLPNMPASHIAILNNFHGPSNSMTLREASIGAVIGESASLIASGRVDMMVVGTTGSRLHPIKMIDAMQQETLAPDACRPFDRNRRGTVLGDGAGALILEDWEHAQKRKASVYGEILAGSYRMRCDRDRHDLRREVIGSVLRDVLRRGETEAERVGHVNAHGLGDQSSDQAEAGAIDEVFGKRENPIPVAAAKGFFGNIGAGAGTIELIAGVLSLQHGVLFPTLGFSTPDSKCPVHPTCGSETPPGDSFVKIAVNPQGQASAVLVRKI